MQMSRALLLLWISAACASRGTEAAEADTTGRRDSIAAVAAASMDEPQVLGLLEHVQASAAGVGTLGGTRGNARDIRDFGLMMAREHEALRRDARALAEGLRLTPERPAVAPDEAPASFVANVESTAQGPAWDRAYVEYVIAAHEAALENTARALAATQSPTTRDYIRRAVPILDKHMDKARSLQKVLARAQPAQPPAPTTR